ncbi:hypothetical protein P154DRAFT_534810 [Amniculicola lignicola CBS 123094]|uniref:Uncharacterized protein n=1 Tax=Amniculicola lignicola CBS 123094 TaxID=1392246 RepID=A0A6A5WFS8_9PLEO|nr:hypothetical protein P154DRAFT_534810 [Amniculicola lignicola CBS 123094]
MLTICKSYFLMSKPASSFQSSARPYPCYISIIACSRTYYLNRSSREARATVLQADRNRGVFPDMLVHFAVHRDDLFTALQRLVDASLGGPEYENPSNSLVLTKWKVDPPRKTLRALLKVESLVHVISQNSIDVFRTLFERHLPTQLVLRPSPIKPLGCDFVFVDCMNNQRYCIQHKFISTPDKAALVRYFSKLWHFLIFQNESSLTIFARPDVQITRASQINNVKQLTVDLESVSAAKGLQAFIKLHSGNVQLALSKFILRPVGGSNDDREEGQAQGNEGVPRGNLEKLQELASLFCDKFNDICYHLGELFCDLLGAHPLGGALIILKDWSDGDRQSWATNRQLETCPSPLLNKAGSPLPDCIVVRFQPHEEDASFVDSAMMFEAGVHRSTHVPVCSSRAFVYVAPAGGFQNNARGENFAVPDKFAVLPSTQCSWQDQLGACKICDGDGNTKERNWTYKQPTIDVREEKSNRRSLMSANFVADATRTIETYSFRDGSIHQYFLDLFKQGMCVMSVNSVLQSTWKHGAQRLVYEPTAQDRFFRRILRTKTPTKKYPSPGTLQAAIEEKQKSLGTTAVAAAKALMADENWGITLRDHIRDFNSEFDEDIHCDHCQHADNCRFFRPEIWSPLMHENICIQCKKQNSKDICTFNKVSPKVHKQVRRIVGFRRHVPCNLCWRNRLGCDNEESCANCTRNGDTCLREMCDAYDEQFNQSFCTLVTCDHLHIDDGYTNATEQPRTVDGCDMRALELQLANSSGQRAANKSRRPATANK